MFDNAVLTKVLLSESGKKNHRHELDLHEELEKQEEVGGTGVASVAIVGNKNGEENECQSSLNRRSERRSQSTKLSINDAPSSDSGSEKE